MDGLRQRAVDRAGTAVPEQEAAGDRTEAVADQPVRADAENDRPV